MGSKEPNPSKVPLLSPNPDQLYNAIINEAPFVSGDSLEVEEAPWFDPDLLKEGQAFIKRNYFAQQVSIVTGLILGLSLKSFATVLYRTGGYGTVKGAFLRHVRTGLYHTDWFFAPNLLQSQFGSFQRLGAVHRAVIRQARKVPHPEPKEPDAEPGRSRVVEALKKDFAKVDTSQAESQRLTYNPPLIYSQFEQAMVLCGLYMPIFLYPEVLGIRSREGMRGFLHFWAVVGRLCGLEDRFNPALSSDRAFQLRLLRNVGIGSLKEVDAQTIGAVETYVRAMFPLLFLPSLLPVLYIGLRTPATPEFNGENLYRLMSWRDRIYAKAAQVAIFLMYYVPLVRVLANRVFGVLTWYSRRGIQLESSNDVA